MCDVRDTWEIWAKDRVIADAICRKIALLDGTQCRPLRSDPRCDECRSEDILTGIA